MEAPSSGLGRISSFLHLFWTRFIKQNLLKMYYAIKKPSQFVVHLVVLLCMAAVFILLRVSVTHYNYTYELKLINNLGEINNEREEPQHTLSELKNNLEKFRTEPYKIDNDWVKLWKLARTATASKVQPDRALNFSKSTLSLPNSTSSLPKSTTLLPNATLSTTDLKESTSSLVSTTLIQPKAFFGQSKTTRRQAISSTRKDSKKNLRLVQRNSNINCFRFTNTSTLPNLLDVNPAKNKSIFFLETSCKSYKNGKITITSRQACAVESAARANSNSEVHLAFTSPGIIKKDESEASKVLEALMSYQNVKLSHVDYEEFLRGTFVESLYSTGKIEKSPYATVQASNFLRLVTLWRYGGLYLDLDILTLKSFDTLDNNYAAAESETFVNNAVLRVDSEGVGHELAEKFLTDLRDNYKGDVWGYNGPALITRVLLKWCKVKTTAELYEAKCPGGVKIYPINTFYPVSFRHWELFFETDANDYILSKMNESYTVHFWNQLTTNATVEVDSDVPYINLAKKFCPKVFAQLSTVF